MPRSLRCLRSICTLRSLRSLYPPRSHDLRKLATTHAIWNPNDIHAEFMTHTLEYICPDDVWKCQGIPIPELDRQLEILDQFQALHYAVNLQGLDAVVWKLLLNQEEGTLIRLVTLLQQYDEVVHGIQNLLE